MNFKDWIMSEEVYPQNKTATVYHRTDIVKIPNLLKSDFRSGSGCLYGCGLYTTFSIDSQFTEYMQQYGDTLVKFKATDLDKYLIVQKSVAMQLLGEKYKISDQFKKFNIEDAFKPEVIEDFDDIQEKVTFSSLLMRRIYSVYPDIVTKIKGAIYYGSNDGYCLLKYPPIEDGTITMLGFSEATWDDKEKKKQLENNVGWVKSIPAMAIKDLRRLPQEERKTKVIDFYDIENDADIAKYLASNQPVPDEDHLVSKITFTDRVLPYMDAELVNKLVRNRYVERLIEKSKSPQNVLRMLANKADPMFAKSLAKDILTFDDNPVPTLNKIMQDHMKKYPENSLNYFLSEVTSWAKPKHFDAIVKMILNSGYPINQAQAKQIMRMTPAEKQTEMRNYILKTYNNLLGI